MNTYEFGKFLTQLRKEKGLTQVELADLLNVTDKAISRWETGKNYPDIEMFERISDVLDVSISELLEGKRVNPGELFTTSEGHIVKQIKRNRRMNKVYLVIISIIILFMIWFGYLALKNQGIFDGVIYKEIPCYSNDIVTMMNNLDGYISQTPKAEGDFIIDEGFFFLEEDKTTNDILYLSGTCENGRAFYINSLYNEMDPRNSTYFIGEFRENRPCVEGIRFHDLKSIVSQIDLLELPKHEKYELTLTHIADYDEMNLNSNEHQKSIKKYTFSEGTLQSYRTNTISGRYQHIQISGFDDGSGHAVASIFYEIKQ